MIFVVLQGIEPITAEYKRCSIFINRRNKSKEKIWFSVV